MKPRKVDLTGKKIGRLLVLGEAPRSAKGDIRWLCKCDCGNEKIILTGGLCYKKIPTKSCGCWHKDRVRELSKEKRKITGKLGSAFLLVINSYKNGAKLRGLSWFLSDKDFEIITKKRCHYCGVEPFKMTKVGVTEWIHNGIDRINNNIGYEPNNCVACCSMCNYMKLDFNVNEFLAHVNQIFHYSVKPR